MDELNSKISATRENDIYWAQAVGLYGYNVSCDVMKSIHSSEINDHSLSVAVTHSVLPDGAATEAKQNEQIDNQDTMISFLNDQNDFLNDQIHNQKIMISFLNDQNDYLHEINDSTYTINTKITKGSDKNLTSVQQNGMYAWHSSTEMWERLSFDTAGFQYGLSVRNLKRNPDVSSESKNGVAGGTAESSTIDLAGFSRCTIFGTTTNTNDPIHLRISSDDSTYITDPVAIISPDLTTGEYIYSTDSNLAVRYLRIRQTDDSSSGAFTLNINTSLR